MILHTQVGHAVQNQEHASYISACTTRPNAELHKQSDIAFTFAFAMRWCNVSGVLQLTLKWV